MAARQIRGRGGGAAHSAPARSIEGWVLVVTNVHEEAQEDDVHDVFAEYGEIRKLELPLDRRTGFVKGYALVEYETKAEADEALAAMHEAEFMERTIGVAYAFLDGPRPGAA
mmetsp:Transcript_17114/g.42039  ORF Transcript_17114/g.42039 Transcript_17114/m.42039 type:complete len:112 (+) Transcript_17114:17-352(+)|eukprot:CAMPEP_0198337776 /NCGR_PEP_ID=MMETSP1450-20131203/31254_1 /TAXON_ID=753684 ORGANISM="Madagascaria erythrocladiodes, Strain CCMP3234" /NCGR_SAMPLE_ID=MMETSP1450 /ASSEMBLY_ACC=CAM_ASM_001115 /LENGTH=111 /DNA_ID=CAMNT_0044042611 /DNA_START=17 /DNA_END=352 /DNA_ORIENTATION=+